MKPSSMRDEKGIALIDPNQVNIKNYFSGRGIPDYEEMFINVSLEAIGRNRSVIIKGVEGRLTSENSKGGLVNLMGSDFNTNKYTTNYYDGSRGEKAVNESFGIQKIDIKINSSYIPQINIQFVDVRGLSFFNREDSPYRMIFDFPPPIFKLTVKGYYGYSLTYKMHLTKHTTEFKSENGNFIIDAQFVAITYAPLTDVLFKYIINFPIIEDSDINLDNKLPPKNTNELIGKLRNLFSIGFENIRNDPKVQRLDESDTTLKKINTQIQILNNFNNYFSDNNYAIEPILYVRQGNRYNLIRSIGEYNRYIEDGQGVLYMGVYVGKNGKLYDTRNITGINVDITYETNYGTHYNNIYNKLKKYIELLDDRRDVSVLANPIEHIKQPVKLSMDSKIEEGNSNIYGDYEYLAIDITKYYVRLIKQRNKVIKQRNELNTEINELINSSTRTHLGMNPTIYNIFKIILDDVDRFFLKLNSTSEDAEEHHAKYYNEIMGNGMGYKDVEKGTIYPFPLFIDKKYNKDNNSNNIITEERVAPIKISNSLGAEGIFPELKLVNDFISTFKDQQIINKHIQFVSSDNNNSWFPFMPVDTMAIEENNELTYFRNPYTDMLKWDSINDTVIERFYDILINRYYVLSQNILSLSYYTTKDKNFNNNLFKLYGAGEANNILFSISDNEMLREGFKTISNKYRSNINNFYGDLTNRLNKIYETKYRDNLEIDKTNNKYRGFYIIDRKFNYNDNLPTHLIDELGNISKTLKIGEGTKYTDQNVYYFPDEKNEYETKFITKRKLYIKKNDKDWMNEITPEILDKYEKYLYENGNDGLIDNSLMKYNPKNIIDSKIYETCDGLEYGNVVDIWYKEMENLTIGMIDLSDTDFNELLIVSQMFKTLTPFTSHNTNKNFYYTIFRIPSLIEMPLNVIYYLGLLATTPRNGTLYTAVKTYILSDPSEFYNVKRGLSFFADHSDVNNNLSYSDLEEIKKLYLYLKNKYLEDLLSSFKYIIDEIGKIYIEKKIENTRYIKDLKSENAIKEIIKDSGIFSILLRKYTIINNKQDSFLSYKRSGDGQYYKNKYKSLSELKDITYNDQYFGSFFRELHKGLDEISKKKIKEESNFSRLSGDEDIITQTYYSFKNINDKWVSGNINNNVNKKGYPFNEGSKSLIDSFVFVDRTMNDISDTIIDPEMLIDMATDYDINVFTVLSQLLSHNGFEFFPLQNFMSFEANEWENSFKILDSTKPSDSLNAFVCMYIGGTSAYPSNIGNSSYFVNDGIVDLFEENSNFNPDMGGNDNDRDNFPYKKVRAFKVGFGEQNQSMFKDFSVDSKEYPETNESIAILSRLAGDEGQGSSIPIGQNLYSLYENRAYRATISGLGNAMIQPTQYFQLANIPLYNGAYVVLDVEHLIESNKMTTRFSGVKILKYPIPRVTNASALFGLGGSTIGHLESSDTIEEAKTNSKSGDSSSIIENKTKYNKMYSFKIE